MKTLIVGAGAGGIASALLARMRGEEVTIFEAHSHIGGCASYFKRGPFVFDAGATTLSGMLPHKPLGILFDLLGEKPPYESVDPGMVIHLSTGEVITYHQDFEKWMTELSVHFPQLEHRKFWKKIHQIDQLGWELLGHLRKFPSFDPQDFFFIFKNPRFLKVLPYFFLSTDMALKFYNLDDPRYREMINGILLISAQSDAPHIPFLVGALSLAYPRETYIPQGGMKGLMDFFEDQFAKRGIVLKKKTKVISGDTCELTLQTGEKISGDRIIYNTLSPEGKEQGSWGAYTLYFATEGPLANPYQQVHLNHHLVKNYFVSSSLKGEVTISTHVAARDWMELDPEEYKRKKKLFEKIIMDDFLVRFSVKEVKSLTAGTPSSFEHYTGRESGFVGGLPFLYGKNPWALANFTTKNKNVFQVGDTIFPGQGLVGVVAGALMLDRYLRD